MLNSSACTAPAGLSPLRHWLFRALAALGIPLLLALGAEGGLRLAGYGYPTGFFLKSHAGGREVWSENPDFGRRFFPPALVRRPQPITLPVVKPPGTVRIFILGESAALGDPDIKFGLSRMLEVLLRERYPGRHFEVVNAAMVAISSQVIVSIARDCARLAPDLWVVYMGNNEMVGPFGSESVFGAQAPPRWVVQAGLWAKTFRLGQCFDAVLRSLEPGHHSVSDWAGMEMMAGEKVRPEAPQTARVYPHFAANLTDILGAGMGAGIPVILSTVGSNLKDCPPFASLHRANLGSAELAEWQNARAAGIAALQGGRLAEAQAALARAASIDDQFADLAFRRGECALQLGRSDEAAGFFRRARDLDALQFRADGRINGIIRQTATTFADQRVSLLDAEQLLATNSPHGVTGAEFFYEHVHLRPAGNYLLARAVAEQTARALGIESATPWVSEPECLRLLGFTDWNRYDALETILERIQRPPFTDQAEHEEQVQQIKEEQAHYLPATQPMQAKAEAAQVAKLVSQRPEDADLRWNLAVLLEAAGDSAGAEAQWHVLITLLPRSSWPLFDLARLLDGLGRPDEARSYYLRCLDLAPEDYDARFNLGRLCLLGGRLPEAIQHLTIAARQRPRATEAHLALGLALVRDRRVAQAKRQFEEVLRLDPTNVHAQAQLRALR